MLDSPPNEMKAYSSCCFPKQASKAEETSQAKPSSPPARPMRLSFPRAEPLKPAVSRVVLPNFLELLESQDSNPST
ncbi:hypothetical protein C1H46_037403 [Malus baccata]|uniref:Uncharacterized protein n=1 Tax=Malus baccata TaxID=106549 RepID=A0A540KS73_MALBA|nr:hypothetical protein C1H46_037403 [Malus baccata]